MDPDVCLAEIRDLQRELTHCRSEVRAAEIGAQLADKVDDLFAWLERGGALPKAWDAHRVHDLPLKRS